MDDDGWNDDEERLIINKRHLVEIMLFNSIINKKMLTKKLGKTTSTVVKIILVIVGLYILDSFLGLGLVQRLTNRETFEDKVDVPKGTLKCTMYYTEWCGYCKTAKPHWNRIMDEYNGKTLNGKPIIIEKVNCDENPEVAKAEKIDGFPTFKFILNGQEVSFNGERTYDSFKKFIDNL